MKNNKITLLSFGTKNLIKSASRLRKQAKDFKIYDNVKIFNEDDILSDDKKILQIKNLSKNSKGYGFWFWKPFLILKHIKELNEGDILHYMDLGCHLNPRGIKRFKQYIDIVNRASKGILAFQYYSSNSDPHLKINYPIRKESMYTKSDLLNFFSVLENKKITDTEQFWAGSFFIKKNTFTINFLKEWLDVFRLRIEVIYDTPSKIKNFNEFIENRYDQSVFSIMCKKNQIENISAYECDWAYQKNLRTWLHLKDKPIIAKRDLQYSLFLRFINRQKKTLRRLKCYLLAKWRDG